MVPSTMASFGARTSTYARVISDSVVEVSQREVRGLGFTYRPLHYHPLHLRAWNMTHATLPTSPRTHPSQMVIVPSGFESTATTAPGSSEEHETERPRLDGDVSSRPRDGNETCWAPQKSEWNVAFAPANGSAVTPGVSCYSGR